MVDESEKAGVIEPGVAATLKAENSDYLYVVDEIYAAVGKSQSKAKVARIFHGLEEPTEAHQVIVGTEFDRFMTLNYDLGLEKGFAKAFLQHRVSITAKNAGEVDDWLRHGAASASSPILHWHGQAGDAEGIVLSGSDYVNFYEENSHNKETLRNVFKTRRVLMIGFGFSDPFIERELNSVMQPLPNTNRHFALIGVPEEASRNIALERRKYATKYKMEVVFYPVLEGGRDHSSIISVLDLIRRSKPRNVSVSGQGTGVANVPQGAAASPISYRNSLFAIGNRQIYCEPSLWTSVINSEGISESKVTLSQVLAEGSNCIIQAPHEYGLTNLGRRIAGEVAASGARVVFREADSVPKYRKAILNDADFATINKDEALVVVLDNFSAIEHQRTVRELISSYDKIRIFVLQRAGASGSTEDVLSGLDFRIYHLKGLTRSDIRSVINVIAPDYNSDTTSSIVDKVYLDLIQLCIPLTPSNVVMYASVLCKDGSFSPVSRLHIVERFTFEALRRASDAYADTFNSINKADLIGEFCYGMFSRGMPQFTLQEWKRFCEDFKVQNLVEFNHTDILGDLVNGRVVVPEGSTFYFRYRMFFSYFVGRYLSSQADLLADCVKNNRHFELDGLVEVLCGTLNDSSLILDDITGKLNEAIGGFYSQYPLKGLDIHDGAKWSLGSRDDSLWDSVAERIENGPASSEELDELKTSIQAERRTENQKVSIIKFIASEQNVAVSGTYLITALESAKQASAASKKAAAAAIINAHALAYEVATVFIPLIAERKYVSWNGFTYINLIEDEYEPGSDAAAKKERMMGLVASALPSSMGSNAADQFGSRKLGQVYLALHEEASLQSSIKRFVLFCLLLRSKPVGWLARAKKIVAATDREDVYLRHMLSATVRQFRQEINTEQERRDLKDLVASIGLRRDANIKSPSRTAIQKALTVLDASDFWEANK